MSPVRNISTAGNASTKPTVFLCVSTAAVTLVVSLMVLSIAVPVYAAHEVAEGACPAAYVGGETMNCTANDDDAEMIGINEPVTCQLGEEIEVDIQMDYANLTNARRFDPAGWVSLDGKSPILQVANGGSQSCSAGVFEKNPNFPVNVTDEDGDSCGDVAKGLTVPSTIINENAPITCYPDANGKATFSGVVTWATAPKNDCDKDSIRGTIVVNKAQCSTVTQPLTTEVQGALEILKVADGDTTTVFDFDYTNDHDPTPNNNPSKNGDPDFQLKEGDTAQTLVAWIGAGNPATLEVTETLVGDWVLTGLSCWVTGDKDTGVGFTSISGGLSVELSTDNPFVTCEFSNDEVVAQPSLVVVKSSNMSEISAPGSVPYSFLITNNGDTNLTGILITDSFLTTFSCEGGSHGFDLNSTESETCTASFLADQDLIDTGDYDPDNQCEEGNLGNLVAVGDNNPNTASDTDFLCIPIANNPDIEIVKSSNPTAFGGAGEQIKYIFDVENTGNITLDNVVVTDPLAGLSAIDCDWDNSSDGSTGDGKLSPSETVRCTATLTTTQDHVDDGSIENTAVVTGDSVRDEQGATDESSLTISFAQIIRIHVTKSYNDGNDAEVTAIKDCNDGLLPDQTAGISPSDPHNFVLTYYTPGEADCTIREEVPFGYTPWYTATGPDALSEPNDEGCEFEDLAGAAGNTCAIVNRIILIDFDVRKLWFDEYRGFKNSLWARASYECWNESSAKSSCTEFDEEMCPYDPEDFNNYKLNFIGMDSYDTFTAWPRYDGTTYCTVTERIRDSSVVSDESDCFEVDVLPGVDVHPEDGDYECTLINTRIYEGVPTLNNIGLALMSLLVLGIGMVGFRRFS